MKKRRVSYRTRQGRHSFTGSQAKLPEQGQHRLWRLVARGQRELPNATPRPNAHYMPAACENIGHPAGYGWRRV
jgi:hypothetical protein